MTCNRRRAQCNAQDWAYWRLSPFLLCIQSFPSNTLIPTLTALIRLQCYKYNLNRIDGGRHPASRSQSHIYAGTWQTASKLLPAGSIKNAP